MHTDYRTPIAGDQRSACPGLNAMANCGVIPHNGRFTSNELYTGLLHMGFSKPLAMMLSKQAVGFSKESPASLSDLGGNCPNQHDGSLTRDDKGVTLPGGHISDATQFNRKRFEYLCSLSQIDSSGQRVIKTSDVALFKVIVEAHSAAYNPKYSLSLNHRVLSLINATNLCHTMGRSGQISVDDLGAWFEQERIPENYTPPSGYGFIASLSNAKALYNEMSAIRTELGAVNLAKKVSEFEEFLSS